MTQPELYPICELGSGQLFMMPKPRAESLQADIAYYKSQGVSKVLSVLRAPEIEILQLSSEAETCEQADIAYENFPIKDMDVPELDALKQLNARLKQEMENGVSIAIHCHGGRGRAGTVAITLMQDFGYSVEEATQVAQTGRKDNNVPVCELQRQFVAHYLKE